ncbi:MAG TPA: methionine--tRNA ligase subunit beta [Candidatus Saccharimonadales bacterium]|nr:methionine--tRNA ligase subunit beta [Candidatus Saccharimonadales bacterium]
MNDKISFDDFAKIELKIGKIVSAEKVEKSEKLLRLEVDFGEEKRQVISGIAQNYSPEELVEKSFVFCTNLEPRNIMGLESQAMILAAAEGNLPVVLAPEKEVSPGTKIR